MTTALPGFAGMILRVNLTSGECIAEATNPVLARKFLGGVGYAAHILYTELKAGIDPLGPENKIVIAPGPLSDNRVPGGGSVMVCFKSPLTEIWGQSRCGGNIGPDIRTAGFDCVVVEGVSVSPVYLEIRNGEGVLKNASAIVGKDVYDKSDWLESRLDGGKGRVTSLCIGPAGENLVRFAAVMHRDRAAGRAGGGAVMGSKNLLGVVVRAGKKIEPAKPDLFKEASRKTMAMVRASDVCAGFHQFGTIGDMPGNDEEGDWPSKNWRSNSWGEGANLFDRFQEKHFIRSHYCYMGCPIGCGRVAKVDEGKFATPEHEGCEYETMSAFTAFVLNKNVDAAVHCDYLCNKLGVDTISAGGVIAFAMDSFEHGVLDRERADGLDLSWGNADVLPALVEKISAREGIGELLAEGVRRAAEILGNGAERYAVHVKGLEGPAHDSRSGKALGITYATGNRGMCHIQPVEAMAFDRGKIDWGMQKYGVRDPESLDRWDEAGKGVDIAILQDGLSVPDIVGTCKFMCYAGITLDHWAEMLSGLTGWDVDGNELLRVAQRVNNLERLFNVREGITRKDDTLPAQSQIVPEFGKYSTEPNCVIQNLDALLEEYYEQRGWDAETGIPGDARLAELGLEAYSGEWLARSREMAASRG